MPAYLTDPRYDKRVPKFRERSTLIHAVRNDSVDFGTSSLLSNYTIFNSPYQNKERT